MTAKLSIRDIVGKLSDPRRRSKIVFRDFSVRGTRPNPDPPGCHVSRGRPLTAPPLPGGASPGNPRGWTQRRSRDDAVPPRSLPSIPLNTLLESPHGSPGGILPSTGVPTPAPRREASRSGRGSERSRPRPPRAGPGFGGGRSLAPVQLSEGQGLLRAQATPRRGSREDAGAPPTSGWDVCVQLGRSSRVTPRRAAARVAA